MIIRHRVNTIAELQEVPLEDGVEVDIRGYGNKLLLNHDPIINQEEHDELENYLEHFQHSFIIFNLKEAGYEKRIIDLAEKHNLNYFLLDVEFPFLYKASRSGFRKIAVRYSEAEPIENVEANNLVDWVWIDTNTKLPLDFLTVEKLKNFKTCLVCPERWGRPEDIGNYIEQMKLLNFKLDMVMTSKENAELWRSSGVLK